MCSPVLHGQGGESSVFPLPPRQHHQRADTHTSKICHFFVTLHGCYKTSKVGDLDGWSPVRFMWHFKSAV